MNINKIFYIYISFAVIVFLFVGIVLGGILNFFNNIPYFDKFLHLSISFFVSGIFGIWLSYKANLKPIYVMLFIFCFVVTVGIFFEIIEFSIDSIIFTNNQHWIETNADKIGFLDIYLQGTGLIDTMGDIIANTIGAAIASLVGFFLLKDKHKSN